MFLIGNLCKKIVRFLWVIYGILVYIGKLLKRSITGNIVCYRFLRSLKTPCLGGGIFEGFWGILRTWLDCAVSSAWSWWVKARLRSITSLYSTLSSVLSYIKQNSYNYKYPIFCSGKHNDPLDSPVDILAYLIVDPYNPDDNPFGLSMESSLLFD